MLRNVLVLSCTAAALIASPCFAQKLPLKAGGEGSQCRTAPPGSGEQLCIRETGSDVNGIHRETSSDFSATRLKRGEQPSSQTNTTDRAQTASPGDAASTTQSPGRDASASPSDIDTLLNAAPNLGLPAWDDPGLPSNGGGVIPDAVDLRLRAE